MTLQRLCKSTDSGQYGQCPAVYVGDLPTIMVAQGNRLDARLAGELQEVGANEGGVSLPAETVLRAAAMFLAARGRPAMLNEVADFLAGWDGK